MTITKTPIQRIVTISIDGAGKVSHAWQVTTFSIAEDGVEITRQQGNQDNIEPAEVGEAVPQAAVLRQLQDLQAKSEADSKAAEDAAAAALSEQKTAADAAASEAAKTIAALSEQIAAAEARLSAVLGHLDAAAAAIAEPAAA